MKSILLKLDDKLFFETEELIKAENISRLSYIKRAIDQYNKWQKKKMLEAQMVREVELLKKNDPDRAVTEEMEAVSLTDLQKHLDA